MSDKCSLGIHRFGIKEPKLSKSGQYRLNNYLERLKKQTEPSADDNKIQNNTNQKKPENKNINSTDNIEENTNENIKIKENINENINENIDENTTENNEKKPIKHKLDDKPIEPPHKKMKLSQKESDDNKKEQEQEPEPEPEPEPDHHPIYDITIFPKLQLPQIINASEAVLKEPIWMEKGNKIISDITQEDITLNEYNINRLQLDQRLINILTNEGYKSYFPVQINVIPAIIRGIVQKRDIAVCSPTGSGKTLAYVLPICHILCKELSDRRDNVRALVVSPSRDLALQLYLVFNKFGSSVGLKVGLSCGQTSFQNEQDIIHNIDVLICTPGRLVDHLNHTQGFNLKHIQFLILDEADRLLMEGSYQDWLFRVYHMIESHEIIENYKHSNKCKTQFKKYNNKICLSSRRNKEYKSYLLKILVSATLTYNPKIISSLKLNNPLYFGSHTNKKYLIPSSINQLFIKTSQQNQLMNFISLIDILKQNNKTAVCFCHTVQIAHRLKRIIEIVFNVIHKQPVKIAELSRLVSARQRPHILAQFRGKKINFLICSDAMSRGLDLPSLDCVINYECVSNIETYVHRIGRTARGIGNGTAYTIIQLQEKSKFKRMLTDVENGDKLNEYKMDMKVIRFHRKYMDKYTEIMNNVLIQEQNGELDQNDTVSADTPGIVD